MDLIPRHEVSHSQPYDAGHPVGAGQAEPQYGLVQDSEGYYYY